MSFQQAFFAELEKTAVIAGGIKFHSFHGTSRKQLAAIKPKLQKASMNSIHTLPVVGSAIKHYSKKSPVLKKAVESTVKKQVKTQLKGFHRVASPDKGHTLYGFSTPGSKQAFMNRDRRVTRSPKKRRELIAHEAFHAKHRILGRSETLARIAGGWKSGRKVGILQRAKDAASSLSDYRKVREHY